MGKIFKALFCCGSRPELIKIAPVFHKLEAMENINPRLCLTGQHRDLMSPHLCHFRITPDYQLDVLQEGQSLDQLMKQLFQQLPDVLDHARPDLVLVQGDTASALASAVIAQQKRLPVAHIEAGLRTYDKNAPFPEEINRQMISKVARWHFCPTEQARQNLLSEKIPDQNIFVTGNTAVDALLNTRNSKNAGFSFPSIRNDSTKPYFLITMHRRESQGAPLQRIIESLLTFARQRHEFDFILPLHANPNTANMINSLMADQSNIYLSPSVSYPHMVKLMTEAFAIVTDSGGVQEEAPSLSTPVIVVRDNTERQEGIDAGCLRLAGTQSDTILYELNLLCDDPVHYKRMQQAQNPFGDGFAANRIAAHLCTIFERYY